MARPAWQIIGVLLAGISEIPAHSRPSEAFAALGDVSDEFAAIRFEDLGAEGRPLPRAASAATEA